MSKKPSHRGADPEGDYAPFASKNTAPPSPTVIEARTQSMISAPPSSSLHMKTRSPLHKGSRSKSAGDYEQQHRNQEGNNNNNNNLLGSFVFENSIAVFTTDPDDVAQHQEAADRALAFAIQEAPPTILGRNYGSDSQEEEETLTGKALAFTQLLIEEFQNKPMDPEQSEILTHLNADAILSATEKFLERQEQFLTSHTSHSHVDIAFTSCDANNRVVWGPSPASFGDGFYTSNNPFSPIFQESPSRLVLVARLKGRVEMVNAQEHSVPQRDRKVNSAILQSHTDDEICVLRRTSQLIPLLTIDASRLDFEHDDAFGNDFVHRIHCLLQRFVDDSFNVGRPPTIITRILPSETRPSLDSQDSGDGETDPDEDDSDPETTGSLAWLSIRPPEMVAVGGTALSNSKNWTLKALIYYSAPASIETDKFCVPSEARLRSIVPDIGASTELCCVCNKHSSNTLFPDCQHSYHVSCLFKRLRRAGGGRCPKCPPGLGHLLKAAARIHTTAKPPALVVISRLDITDKDSRLDKAKGRSCVAGASESFVTLVAATAPDGTVDLTRLSLIYPCGKAFDINLNKNVPPSSMGPAATWSTMFQTPEFLTFLQTRTREHTLRCTKCKGPARTRRTPKITIGLMPSGTMRVDEMTELTCSGHPPGTLLITYRLEQGEQADYHETPGQSLASVYREAFLPNNRQGRQLLKRLIFLFYRGLTFVVERGGTIQWGTVPHKSSLSPGTSGYPDPSYFVTANEELNQLSVPEANKL